MKKAEFILQELERGNFNVLSELTIVKMTTTENPEILPDLYSAYDTLESLVKIKKQDDYRPGQIVIVDLPELKAYKKISDELEEVLLNGGQDSPKEEALKREADNLYSSMSIDKLSQQDKEFEIYKIEQDKVILKGLPNITWEKTELKIKL